MMNSIFSDTLSKGHVYLLPRDTGAVSYTYTSDLLFFNAHMPDKFDKICDKKFHDQEDFDDFFESYCSECTYNDGDRCSSFNDNEGVTENINCPLGYVLPPLEDQNVIVMGPTLFKQGLKLHGENRFEPCHNVGSFAYLENFRVNNGVIETTGHTVGLSNVHTESQRICWGNVGDRPKSLRGLVELYMRTEHNGDYVNLTQTEENCEYIRNHSARFKPKEVYKFLFDQADALYLVHLDVDVKSYFWLIAAGYRPLPENQSILAIPLEEKTISHDSRNYQGYLTSPDACGRVWFVNLFGDLVGQVDDSVTVH